MVRKRILDMFWFNGDPRILLEHFGSLPTTVVVTVTAAEVAVAIWVVVVV
jgi:hypothetical protein